jgi:hypothetical protein
VSKLRYSLQLIDSKVKNEVYWRTARVCSVCPTWSRLRVRSWKSFLSIHFPRSSFSLRGWLCPR